MNGKVKKVDVETECHNCPLRVGDITGYGKSANVFCMAVNGWIYPLAKRPDKPCCWDKLQATARSELELCFPGIGLVTAGFNAGVDLFNQLSGGWLPPQRHLEPE